MSKGTIVLVPFPFTDLSGNKVRPALVLFNSNVSEDCIVAFISSVKQKTINSLSVRVKMSQSNGLRSDSIIRVDKLATLQKKIVLGELGKLELNAVSEVNKKLIILFHL